MSERSRVARYYDDKTARLLEKYGPGPRVHFHTGRVLEGPPAGASVAELRRGLVQAQESLLLEAVTAWQPESFAGHVVDVGCGLGGTMLFLLENSPAARVTGVTLAESHAAVVSGFAAEAGVAKRVSVEMCDAADIEGEARFDAAICVEASCYFDRARWLACMRRVLKPGARVFLIDCFLGRNDVGPPFDAYWLTNIGTLASYQDAAAAHGFTVADVVELNESCRSFWDWSLAYTERKLADAAETPDNDDELRRLSRSRDAHERLRDAFRDGGIRYLRAVLERMG